MSPIRQEKVVTGLRRESAYPHKASRINVEETHISWIFLTGLYAYKIKKELKFGQILDFSTLKLRKKFCQEEIKLNKILCGGMYKKVVKVIGGHDNNNNSVRITNLEHKGKPLEYAVKMLEIPQKFRMDNLLSINEVNSSTIDKLVETLVKFHFCTKTNAKIKNYGRPKFKSKNR